MEYEYEQGKAVYDVEFYIENEMYDYEIDAFTGAILSHDYEIEGFTIPSGNSSDIGTRKAKEITLGIVLGASNNHIKIVKDYEDGRLVYEGEIIYQEVEYEFKIDAETGTILK